MISDEEAPSERNQGFRGASIVNKRSLVRERLGLGSVSLQFSNDALCCLLNLPGSRSLINHNATDIQYKLYYVV